MPINKSTRLYSMHIGTERQQLHDLLEEQNTYLVYNIDKDEMLVAHATKKVVLV